MCPVKITHKNHARRITAGLPVCKAHHFPAELIPEFDHFLSAKKHARHSTSHELTRCSRLDFKIITYHF